MYLYMRESYLQKYKKQQTFWHLYEKQCDLCFPPFYGRDLIEHGSSSTQNILENYTNIIMQILKD